MDPITSSLERHYGRCFAEHGPVPRGVDWGPDASDTALRYDRMLAVTAGFEGGAERGAGRATLLDVGCGYGGLWAHARQRGLDLSYTGIDVCAPMIDHARRAHPEARFERRDLFDGPGLIDAHRHDFVVCNGILTQKLDASIREMDAFARRVVERLYARCRVGVAVNFMTNQVNFMAANLFYKSPSEALTHALALTPKVRLDHAYPLYEFTLYLYRPAVGEGRPCGSV